MHDKRFQTYLIMLYAYFSVGCMVLAANTALEFMIKDFGWSDSQGGLFISFLSLGNLASSIFTGMLCKGIGRKRVIILYGMLLFVCYMLMSVLNLPMVFYPLALLSGLYWGGINSITNTTITELYSNSGSKLNICNACYGVGAVLLPLLLSLIVSRGGSWRICFRIVAMLGLLMAVLAWVRPIPEMKVATPAANEKGASKPLAFWKELPFYLGAVLFFCYVGVESSASSWLPSYLSQYNSSFTEIPSATIVSLLWLTLIIGRLLCAGPGAKIDCKKLIVVLSCGFLLGVIGMVCFVKNTVLLLAAVVLTGLSMSGMYASCVANSSRYVANSPLGAGILFGMGGLGSTVIPYVAGLVSDNAGLRVGMTSLCVFLICMLVAAVVNLNHSPAKEHKA
jgi:MFS transporter, FHS family, glucose/mannose:H+ symporter